MTGAAVSISQHQSSALLCRAARGTGLPFPSPALLPSPISCNQSAHHTLSCSE